MMKKTVLIAAGALLLFASCKKDYTCVCSVNGTEVSSTTITDTKSKAEDQCNEGDANLIIVVTEC